jgi:L-lactate dehydrogenase complex protein LldF
VSAGEPFDRFAAGQAEARRNAVRLGSKAEYEKRLKALTRDFADPDSLRRLAGAIKQHTLDHLDAYLERATGRLEAHGATVHFAADAEEACKTVLGILQRRGAKRIVKTKSMATEEVELGAFLERHGVESIETDLGEFVVQLDTDLPSHIV